MPPLHPRTRTFIGCPLYGADLFSNSAFFELLQKTVICPLASYASILVFFSSGGVALVSLVLPERPYA